MEGPSLVILREELQPFLNKKVQNVSGNTKQPKDELKNCKLIKIETWGKMLFMTFEPAKKSHQHIVTKTHFLLFGSYRINEPRENRSPRLELKFRNGVLYFYSCSFQFNAEEYLSLLDKEIDLMSAEWNLKHVLKLMGKKRESYLCDLFLDQTVFAGSGNIIKNEVLFNIRRHPLTKLADIDRKDWPKLAKAVRKYCFNFYEWKKIYELKRHWQVYRKSVCPICQRKIERKKLGKLNRMNFTCPHCQKLSLTAKRVKVYEVLPIKSASVKKEHFDH